MLDFSISKESKDWLKEVKNFVQEHILTRDDLDTHNHFPMDLYQKAFEIGIMTALIPKEYGGEGKSFYECILAAEECAYGDLGFTTSAFLSRLSLSPLLLFGTEEQKHRWLTPMTKELQFSAFCFTEPEGSTNLGSRPATTTATPAEGGYIVNGVKSTISNASVSSLYTVFARITPGDNSMSCFLIPRDAKGVSVTKPYKKMGQRAGDTGVVTFENVFVPNEDMVGRPGQGAQIALKSLRTSRVGVGAMATGVCSRARDLAKIHCHHRKTGEGTPVIYEQDIKFKFANIEAKIEMIRSFTYRASWELENGPQATKVSSAVKLMAGRIAYEITNEALELLGGRGYMQEGKVEKLVRDAKILQIYEGTEAVQKILIADTAIRLGKLGK